MKATLPYACQAVRMIVICDIFNRIKWLIPVCGDTSCF